MSIVVCPRCGAKNRVEDRAGGLRPVCGKCHAALDTAGATEAVKIISDASFAADVLGVKGRPVLVDCWAPWCGPCRMIAPAIDQLAGESGGRWVVAKLNVDENPQTSQRFHIDSIPALLIFKDGGLVDRIVGLVPKDAIERRLKAQVLNP